ncbi:HXXXD-type acyl-transferase family protein [Rhynchospora pubera]|uniref:HXXXD-type acyl-transferase family protein n=1 Tax=Rhynchospora pubera TaxID=906938 RepID=A0AAV8DT20_9POAL|nr:HXXXD-type acyl-transferase family protein [Rhynchospora pubera]
MNITIESSKLVKPTYNNGNNAPSTNHHVRLSVFDKVTFNIHDGAAIHAFNPPTRCNSDIEKGLSKVLSEYREWAGRLGEDEEGNSIIFLNDQGVRFVEAVSESKLRNVLPSKPTKEIQSLYPSLDGVQELLQVQLTRFACGSLVVAITFHHQIADGQATGNFLAAWGLATRGLPIDSTPLCTRSTLFQPRDPPLIQYDHQKIEYMNKMYPKHTTNSDHESNEEEIVIQKVHFTNEFINKLRANASTGVPKHFSRFEVILAHLWRVITKARGLHNHETTQIRISVNGRRRMDPKVPNEYFGNLVLWAFPRSKVKDLINRPLRYAAELIHDEVAKVNDMYFKSFIDFASSGIIKKEGLVSTAVMNKKILSPDLEVDSWLTFRYFDMDFGSGSPYYFMPTYYATEGMLFILPSYLGDGSIDAFVPLLNDNLDTFNMCCYSLD